MKSINILMIISLLLIAGCLNESSNVEWKFFKKIKLDNISPTGIAIQHNFIWLSDVKNNRVVKTDLSGNFIEEYSNIKRPMHISIFNSKIFIPEYLTDKLKVISESKIDSILLKEKPNAPSGVSLNDSLIAIADFYNHRIILQGKNKITIIGKEGHNKGELYYPTDVVLINDKIYVADAYNNRVQVFDLEGKSLQIIGEKDCINVAAGIELTDKYIFVTDFEGNRILIYNLECILIKILINNLDKPIDISFNNKLLLVLNYGNKSISMYNNNL